MKTHTNFQISIPKPCHEDWNKFTPDQKGAFCKVCSKSVHDFTEKTSEEIKTILIEEMSVGKKVCGRFSEDQITPSDLTVTEMPSLNLVDLNFRRLKRFALALFLVFGGLLFSTSESSAQEIMGKVALTPKAKPESEDLKGEVEVENLTDTIRSIAIDTIAPKTNTCNMVKGDVEMDPIEIMLVMGNISIVSEPVVEQVDEFTKIDTVAQEEVISEDQMVMGMIALPENNIDENPVFENEIAEEQVASEFAVRESTYVELPIQKEDKVMKDDSTFKCYPNPSKGFINLNYYLKKNALTSIMLYDVTGNLVKTLVSAQNMYASDYVTQFDIRELQSGIYFCTLQSGEEKYTKRIILEK